MEIKTIINKYLDRTQIYRTKGTFDYYTKVSKSLYRGFDYLGINYVSDMTESTQIDLLLYFKNIVKKKNSQINADIGFLYTVLKYYDVDHKLTPFEKLPDDTTSFRVINDKVLYKLIEYLNSLDLSESNNLIWSLTIFLMLETGVRMNEILNIKTINVDFTSNTIVLDKTKNGKKRVVFFDVLSKDLLKEVVSRKKEYLIWNFNKDMRMTRDGLFYFFNRIAENVETEIKITAHRLRKTFATRLLKRGCPLTTIQKLLGHTDIRMTMKYLEISSAMIEKDYFEFYPYADIEEKKQPL